MSRVLAVDPGTKRVGLAISDRLRLIARPLEVVPTSRLLDRLEELVDSQDVDVIVVGLPTGLGGGEGKPALDARHLAGEIEERLGVEVVLVDERFTSRIAERALLEAGTKRRARRDTVDKVAAAIILQSYLDAEASKGNPEAG